MANPHVETKRESGHEKSPLPFRRSLPEYLHNTESVHAGEAKANPAQFSKDAAAEKSQPHDQRPQEQRANAAQKAFTKEIKQAVKQIEKQRKKDDQ